MGVAVAKRVPEAGHTGPIGRVDRSTFPGAHRLRPVPVVSGVYRLLDPSKEKKTGPG